MASVYMVNGVDANGDTHMFVTTDFARAEAQHGEIMEQLRDGRANWLER